MNRLMIIPAMVLTILFCSTVTSIDSIDNLEKKSRSESLAEFLFRARVFKLSRDGKKVLIDEEWVDNNREELLSLWENWLLMKPLTSPLNLSITYRDDNMTQIDEVRSIAPVARGDELLQDLDSMMAYLKMSLPQIQSELNRGHQPKTKSFQECQEPYSMRRATMAGEELTICEMTKEIETMLMSHLLYTLENYDASLESVLYFGSRVMPRSELIKRQPILKKTLPIHDDGVIKNSVRVGGLTSISDLEIAVLIRSKSTFSMDDLKTMSKDFRASFAKKFRRFPISIKLIPLDEDEIYDSPFDPVFRYYKNNRDQTLSPYQFTEVPLMSYLD